MTSTWRRKVDGHLQTSDSFRSRVFKRGGVVSKAALGPVQTQDSGFIGFEKGENGFGGRVLQVFRTVNWGFEAFRGLTQQCGTAIGAFRRVELRDIVFAKS